MLLDITIKGREAKTIKGTEADAENIKDLLFQAAIRLVAKGYAPISAAKEAAATYLAVADRIVLEQAEDSFEELYAAEEREAEAGGYLRRQVADQRAENKRNARAKSFA
jgi:hypothetical protein